MNVIPLTEWAERFIILPNKEPLRWEWHQRRILDHAFEVLENRTTRYQTVLYSCPKKSGKTTIDGIVLAWFAYNIEAPNELFSIASKREQAISRAFNEAKGFIERNAVLRREVVSMTEDRIRLRKGTTIRAIPNDYTGEAGSNHGLVVFDELWGFQSERDYRLYDEFTPVPTRKISLRIVSSYAGFENEGGPLRSLYDLIFETDEKPRAGIEMPLDGLPCYVMGDLFCYWDHKPRMPWQTTEYYESQRKQLRPNTYLRLHENRWVTSEQALFDMEKWDACVDSRHGPPLPDKHLWLWVGVDASTKRDRSAIVSVYRDGDKIKLGPKRFWQPSKAEPMDLEETMEAYLLELHHAYTLRGVLYDPFQFHRSATTLEKKGLPMVEFPQTTTNLTEIGQNLFDLVEYGNIVLYSCKDMRYEAGCAVAKKTGRGLRIVKEKSTQKIDQIVALAMATREAVVTHRNSIFTLAGCDLTTGLSPFIKQNLEVTS